MQWSWQKYGLLLHMLNATNQGELTKWEARTESGNLIAEESSVRRWDRDEGWSSSITDDSQSALTFNTCTASLRLCSYSLLSSARGIQVGKTLACTPVGVFTGENAHVFICDAHLHKYQMSKVHCSTLLTSNVTNNYFLQLHCSNPFSGLQNGNIITFLWCSAFDKTALAELNV